MTKEHGEQICGIKYCKKNACRNPQEIIKAIKENRCWFSNINPELHTPEVCKEAIKRHGSDLRIIKKELITPELRLLGVKQDGSSIQYIKNEDRTPELRLEAVRQNGYALKYIEEQTPEICVEAILNQADAYDYVKPEWKRTSAEETLKYLMSKLDSEDFGDFLNTGSIPTREIKDRAILIKKASTCSNDEVKNILKSPLCNNKVLEALYLNQNIDGGFNEYIASSKQASPELLVNMYRDDQAYETIEAIINNPNASNHLLCRILMDYNEDYIGDYAYAELEKRPVIDAQIKKYIKLLRG